MITLLDSSSQEFSLQDLASLPEEMSAPTNDPCLRSTQPPFGPDPIDDPYESKEELEKIKMKDLCNAESEMVEPSIVISSTVNEVRVPRLVMFV